MSELSCDVTITPLACVWPCAHNWVHIMILASESNFVSVLDDTEGLACLDE